MKVAGHDLRLLAAACASWAVLATLLALRVTTASVVLVGVTAAVAGAVAVALASTARPARVLALGGAVTGLVTIAAAGHLAVQRAGPMNDLAAQRASGVFVGVVTAQPRQVKGAVTPGGERFVIAMTVQELDARGARRVVSTPIVVIGDARWRSVTWRSRVEVRGRLSISTRLGSARALLAARDGPRIVEGPGPLVSWLERLRAGLKSSAAGLPADPKGLLPALVVGDVSGVPPQLDADMNVAGLSHLNAVSGSNVTIVLIGVVWCVSWLGTPRLARTCVAFLAVGAYVLVCHPDPSVVRAGAMGVVGLVGTSWGRPKAACPALGAAVVLLLGWDPWLAISPGFALSALATLGLVLFARTWAQSVTRRLPMWSPRWGGRAVEVCLIPVAAQALCLPILVCLSGSVSLVSLPANVLAEPFVAPATLAGMVVLLLTPMSSHVAALVAWCAGVPTWAIAEVAHHAVAVPGGSLPWPPGVMGVGLAAALVTLLLFAWRVLSWLGMRGWAAVVFVALLPASVLVPIPGEGAADPGWVYAQCDVGQGDAALVRTGDDSAVAVDVGPADADMVACLDRHRVARLDAIILTHFHADHVGGLSSLLDAAPAAPIFTTWMVSPAPQARSRARGERDAREGTLRVISEHRKVAQTLAPGQQLRVGQAVLDVLGPRRAVASGSAENNASLVIDVTTQHLHALLLGDVEREAQVACLTEVARRASTRRYDVLKVAHHGSANQSEALYRAASAKYGLIGVGAGNDYGHPKPALLALLAATNTAAYRTDRSGDLDVVPVGSALTVEPQR